MDDVPPNMKADVQALLDADNVQTLAYKNIIERR